MESIYGEESFHIVPPNTCASIWLADYIGIGEIKQVLKKHYIQPLPPDRKDAQISHSMILFSILFFLSYSFHSLLLFFILSFFPSSSFFLSFPSFLPFFLPFFQLAQVGLYHEVLKLPMLPQKSHCENQNFAKDFFWWTMFSYLPSQLEKTHLGK